MVIYVFRYRIDNGSLNEKIFLDPVLAISEVSLFIRSCKRKNIELWYECTTERR